MTLRERVQRTQLALEAIAGVAALLWAIASALVVVIVVALLNSLVGLPPSVFDSLRTIAVSAGVFTAMVILWRARFAWALDRVALWIEERAPELRYALVTAAEAQYAGSFDHLAQPMLGRIDTGAFVRRAAVRAVGPAAAAVIIAFGLLMLMPAEWREAMASTGGSEFRNATESALLAGSRLKPLSARVVPPSYANVPAETIAEPATIAGIRGSRVVLRGEGAPTGIAARLTSTAGVTSSIAVAGANGNWTAAFVMTDTTPALLELTDRNYKRAIVVNPRADAVPVVKLRLPARDTALRTPSGTLQLSADITDDIGLGGGQFEYIISSGSEETFNFKQGVLGAARFGGEKNRTLSMSVPYSYFKLGEGDRLSIRAVANDLNSLSGPGKGFSETRTIRIARKDEYDSLSIEAAAPSGDTAMMSLRMLIIETEKLEASRARLLRDTLVIRSRVLARQTDQVRAAVLPLARDEGGDAPEVTIDTESTERAVEVVSLVRGALNDLEEASRKLDVADPHLALPPMYKAYKALQSFRNFKRYYFRGATRPVIVDIQRVRLTGKTKGTAAPMRARAVATSGRDRMRAEYSSAVEQLRGAPGKGVTMLTMLRVEALKTSPALTAALEEALSAIAAGRSATTALIKARRILDGTTAVTDSLPAWSGW